MAVTVVRAMTPPPIRMRCRVRPVVTAVSAVTVLHQRLRVRQLCVPVVAVVLVIPQGVLQLVAVVPVAQTPQTALLGQLTLVGAVEGCVLAVYLAQAQPAALALLR
jgi:hypothetical protein